MSITNLPMEELMKLSIDQIMAATMPALSKNTITQDPKIATFIQELVLINRQINHRDGICRFLGGLTGEKEFCGLCGVRRDVPLSYCTNDEHEPTTHFYKCQLCPLYQKKDSIFQKEKDDPSCGVVVGVYHWSKLAVLQIALIRELCGKVPILLHDDSSRADHHEELKWVSKIFNVSILPNEKRQGHLWGDTLAFRNGITWAKERNIQVLAKLSQRFLILKPRWLQDYGRRMLDEGKAIASQKCRHKNIRFAVRTEACLLDVDKWHTPEILHLLSPESGQVGGEPTIGHIVNNIFGGEMYRWPIMTPERHYQYKGDVLWHHQNDNKKCEEQYRALAAKYGITLDDDFQCGRPAGS